MTKAQRECLEYFERCGAPAAVGRLWRSAHALEYLGYLQIRVQYSPFGSFKVAEITESGKKFLQSRRDGR